MKNKLSSNIEIQIKTRSPLHHNSRENMINYLRLRTQQVARNALSKLMQSLEGGNKINFLVSTGSFYDVTINDVRSGIKDSETELGIGSYTKLLKVKLNIRTQSIRRTDNLNFKYCFQQLENDKNR